MNKNELVNLLNRMLWSRSSLDPRNYIRSYDDNAGKAAYRGDQATRRRHLNHGKVLLAAVANAHGITGEAITAELLRGNRLSLENGKLEYTAGQYYPMEYRAAICRLCATLLWYYHRNDFAAAKREGESDGDSIRRNFRRMFGRAIGKAWFN